MEFFEAINTNHGNLIIARQIIWAGDSASRRRGLLDHQSLGPDDGMYIVPSQWVHTFGMQFPIDIAFLDKDGRVLAIHHSLAPRRLSRICFRAEGALELAAGRLRATSTEEGDVIALRATSPFP